MWNGHRLDPLRWLGIFDDPDWPDRGPVHPRGAEAAGAGVRAGLPANLPCKNC